MSGSVRDVGGVALRVSVASCWPPLVLRLPVKARLLGPLSPVEGPGPGLLPVGPR